MRITLLQVTNLMLQRHVKVSFLNWNMDIWKHTPIVRILPFFLAGIIVAIYWGENIPILHYAMPVFVAFTLFLLFWKQASSYRLRWVFGLVLKLTFFFVGLQLVVLNTAGFSDKHYTNYVNRHDTVLAIVNNDVSERNNSMKTILEIIGVQEDGNWHEVDGESMAYFAKDSAAYQLHRGDMVVFQANFQEVQPPQNPHEFNYQRYLRFHNIYEQIYLPEKQWKVIDSGYGNPILIASNQLRNELLSILKKYGLHDNEFAVASALILGRKDFLDADLIEQYASAGAMHVLAVSGLHVGIIYLVFNYMLFFMNRKQRVAKAVILIGVLWFYACLTGLSPSVMRAATMFSFIVVGQSVSRPTNIYNILASSALVLLVIDPFLIMEVGFQLSYLAVLGIVYLQPKIYNKLYVRNKILDKIWAITAVSFAAQAATFPLGLHYFHQFPTYFLFSNLIVIPAATVILYLGLVVFLTSFFPAIVAFFASVLQWVIFGLNSSVQFIDDLPGSIIRGVSISVPETWLIYLFMIFVLLFIAKRKIKLMFYGMAAFSVLLGLNIIEAVQNKSQCQFIVYKVNNHSAYDFISGTNHVLLADSTLLGQDDRIMFHMRHHWWEMNIKQEQMANCKTDFKSPILNKTGPFIKCSGFTVAILQDVLYDQPVASRIKIDYLLVPDGVWFDAEKIAANFNVGLVIIDSSVGYYKGQTIQNLCADAGLPCHNVNEQGAFVLDL